MIQSGKPLFTNLTLIMFVFGASDPMSPKKFRVPELHLTTLEPANISPFLFMPAHVSFQFRWLLAGFLANRFLARKDKECEFLQNTAMLCILEKSVFMCDNTTLCFLRRAIFYY
jgi:hypothetical protein